ncbi:MAG: hypothetical protein MJB14_01460 [Spirochaetes bacterium]|nr:hypothetical protein [Spirochaetota bacterium]
MKKYLLLALLLLISCMSRPTQVKISDEKSKTPELVKSVELMSVEAEKIPVKLHGFRYTVPEDMYESPEAFKFNLRNLILQKESQYQNSPIVISIRHTNKFPEFTTDRFAKQDQSLLQDTVKVFYEHENWKPKGLDEKNIDYASYQFYYFYGKTKIYQRSVYIKNFTHFYVVSLSTKEKLLLIDKKNDYFWNSIYVD